MRFIKFLVLAVYECSIVETIRFSAVKNRETLKIRRLQKSVLFFVQKWQQIPRRSTMKLVAFLQKGDFFVEFVHQDHIKMFLALF